MNYKLQWHPLSTKKLNYDDLVTALEDVCGLKPGTLKGRRCYPRQNSRQRRRQK